VMQRKQESKSKEAERIMVDDYGSFKDKG